MSGNAALYGALANAVLILHVGIVLFIVGGLLLTIIGGVAGWRWVRNVCFRALHLLGIACIAMEAWLGIVCPLTTLEQWLREQAGQAAYAGDFIAYWLRKCMFYDAQPWVFIAAYSAFGLVVLLSWFFWPPNMPWRRAPPPQR